MSDVRTFGSFEIDLESAELRRSGRAVRLAPQPARVLATLVSRPGETVSRDELRRVVWADRTFVDFDQGLNFCIRQIRAALGDAADTARFIETVPKRGYRFVAPVGTLAEAAVTPSIQPSGLVPKPTAAVSAASSAAKQGSRGGALRGLVRAALVVCAVATLAWHHGRPAEPAAASNRTTLAVLPFESLGEDPQQDYVAEGLTRELSAHLRRLDPQRLGVIAGSKAPSRSAGKSAAAIGRELGVHHLVQGRIWRSGGMVRVSAELIRVPDQIQVWSETYETDLRDLRSLQRRIGVAIATRVAANIGAAGVPLTRPPDVAAYDLYLRGRFYWNKRTGAWVDKAVDSFQASIQRDPTFAPAYAALGDCYITRSRFIDAAAFADKALALDQHLAEAHVTRGHALMHLLDWAGAESAFQRALELDPASPQGRYFHAEYLMARGRRAEAIAEATRAQELDPVSALTSHVVGVIMYYSGDYDGAVLNLRRALEFDPAHHFSHGRLGQVYDAQGRLDEAVREWQQMPASIRGAYSYARAGRVAEAERIITATAAQPANHELYHLGVAYVALGRPNEALAWLSRALDQRAYDAIYLNVDPRLARPIDARVPTAVGSRRMEQSVTPSFRETRARTSMPARPAGGQTP